MMVLKGADIVIIIFIILTDFLNLNKFCVFENIRQNVTSFY